MIASALKRIFTPDSLRQQAHLAYVQIVTQARRPVFFSEWGVPDTVDGRFDVILLHLSLVIHRMESQSPEARHFVRVLSEVFFADMDRNLRELGAGDTGVGIRVKNMAQAFYGRLKAYGDALEGTEKTALGEAIGRNIYRNAPSAPSVIEQWVAYSERNAQALSRQPLAALLQGQLSFSE